ncbi:futalosine hydrolase [Desulfopila sp. IMCC35008]|uniref:futalosine hydrolase n=1 Tax=Desulfopila sp. IMCC35008 TaxID=2653858 RepID=UPI0013D0FA60|nr:futalosine hydrolase [Desulfopila sp. IMCC35008]
MILVVAATEMELRPFIKEMGPSGKGWETLISGVGPIETAVRLGSYLAGENRRIDSVFNFGVGGAYIPPQPQPTIPLLSVCLAEREIFGDLGICHGEKVEYFSETLSVENVFSLDRCLLDRVFRILETYQVESYLGTFVTVNSASGRLARGDFLRQRWNGICENMEGAAVARVCREVRIPLVEMRVISNLVEDRDPSKWLLRESCERAGKVGALIVKELI